MRRRVPTVNRKQKFEILLKKKSNNTIVKLRVRSADSDRWSLVFRIFLGIPYKKTEPSGFINNTDRYVHFSFEIHKKIRRRKSLYLLLPSVSEVFIWEKHHESNSEGLLKNESVYSSSKKS